MQKRNHDLPVFFLCQTVICFQKLIFETQIQIWFHLLFCPTCTAELKKLQKIENILNTDFLPASPEFEEILMERIYKEFGEESEEELAGTPIVVSLRMWVIIGFFILLSLCTSFFGMNFVEIANAEGLSFLLPVGITIGMVVTCYGALFIGSHLKELSSLFKLQ